jgi:LPS O-antigen subunit length determinant protein (WzzB/FepE family)
MEGFDFYSHREAEFPDLRSIFRRFWKLRRPILFSSLFLSILIFSLLFWVQCQYTSEAFLRAPRKFAEYNEQKVTFWDRQALQRYLQANRRLDDETGRFLLENLNERFVQAHVLPVLPLSKDDLRYVGDAKTALNTVGILGFSISFKDRLAPERAQARVQLMGNFIKDATLHEDLLDTIRNSVGEAKAKKQQIDNQIIQNKVALTLANSRLDAARAIAGKYPQASKMEARQLLSTGNDNQSSRFLSPMAQLVGIETEIADLRSQLTLLERDAAQNALRVEFYDRIEQRSPQVLIGNALLEAFVQTSHEIFTSKDLQDDKVREVYNQIMLIAEQARIKHFADQRFISGPTLPDRRSGPSVLLLSFFSMVGGLALAMATTLMLDSLIQSASPGENSTPEKNFGLGEDSLRVGAKSASILQSIRGSSPR